MNSIEERDNLIALMQEALKFYADMRNYDGAMGTIAPIQLDEYGSQARFVLNSAKLLKEANEKMQEDYDKLIMETINHEDMGGSFPIDMIKVLSGTQKEENNLTKMRGYDKENT